MHSKTKRIMFLNQMAGPLFRELAEDFSEHVSERCELYTGHPDTIKAEVKKEHLVITKAPEYNRKTYFTRVFSWLQYTILAFFKLLKADKHTLVFIVSNPPILAPVTWIASKIKRFNYVVLVYDIHPDTLVQFGALKENSFIVSLWRRVNRIVWNRAQAVITIGEVMAERVESHFNAEQTRLGRVAVVPPWADTKFISPIKKSENRLADELGQLDVTTVLYSGNMGVSHDIESMLEAALKLKDRDDIKFLFIGEGQKWSFAKCFAEENNLSNVQILPFQPEEVLPLTMALGDISLVALDKGAEGLMVPSKMYYYMAAGSAVMGICQGKNDLEASIKLSGGGVIVPPQAPDEIASTIVELVDNPVRLNTLKQQARASSIENFSRQACVARLLNEFKSVSLL